MDSVAEWKKEMWCRLTSVFTHVMGFLVTTAGHLSQVSILKVYGYLAAAATWTVNRQVKCWKNNSSGEATSEHRGLVEYARRAMWQGIRACEPGKPLYSIGNAIGEYCAEHGKPEHPASLLSIKGMSWFVACSLMCRFNGRLAVCGAILRTRHWAGHSHATHGDALPEL